MVMKRSGAVNSCFECFADEVSSVRKFNFFYSVDLIKGLYLFYILCVWDG